MSNSPILDSNIDSFSLMQATVVQSSDGVYQCLPSGSSSHLLCRKAKSVFVDPVVGDVVLITYSSGFYYILNILSSDFKIFSISSTHPIMFTSPSVSVNSGLISFNSQSFNLTSGSALFSISNLEFLSKRVKFLSDYVLSRIDLFVSKFKNRVSNIEGNDVTVAKQIHLKASELIRQKSNLIQINASSYILIDGKKILLG